MRKPIIGVMGVSDGATEQNVKDAYELGKLVAKEGWVLLSGGVKSGVMDAVNKGAKEANGFTIGIIPRLTSEISKGVDIPIMTDMGSARNNINVLSSYVIITCGISAGVSSEIAFALQERASKPVILLGGTNESNTFWRSLRKELIHIAESPKDAIEKAKELLK